jgi:hypothetical protein
MITINDLGNGVQFDDDGKIVRYERVNEGIISEQEQLFDFYIIRLFYKDGTTKDIRAYCELGTSDNLEHEEKNEFFYRQLFGKNGLIIKERRNDYLFLGGISKENDGQKFSINNKDQNGKMLQRIIADRVEKLWPKLSSRGDPKDFDLLDMDFYFHSGGEDINEVFQNGLRSRFGSGGIDGFCSLESTFHHVSGEWCEYSRLYDCVKQYGDRAGRYVYILKIRSIYRGSRVTKDGNLYPPMPTHRLIDYESGDSYITPEIIYGVYDTVTDEIYLNPNFNLKYNPEGLSYDQETYNNVIQSGAANASKWREFMESRRTMTFPELVKKDRKSLNIVYSINAICNKYGIKSNSLNLFQKFNSNLFNSFNSSRHR